MSRKGNRWANAVAESFFATLKKELVRDDVFEPRVAARSAVFEYIEVFYNRQRLTRCSTTRCRRASRLTMKTRMLHSP
jgi:transposase InsO family protein